MANIEREQVNYCKGRRFVLYSEMMRRFLEIIKVLVLGKQSGQNAKESYLWCPVDLQKTLPFGSREDIKNEAQTLIYKWGTSEGGFIGRDYEATEEDHSMFELRDGKPKRVTGNHAMDYIIIGSKGTISVNVQKTLVYVTDGINLETACLFRSPGY